MIQASSTENTIVISGTCHFDDGRALTRTIFNELHQHDKFVRIDFSQVSACDSSLLALIMCITHYGHANGCEIEFSGVPTAIDSIAKLSKLRTHLNI